MTALPAPAQVGTAAPRLVVRPTTPADLPAVVALLSEREGRALDPADVASALCGLNPEHLAGWLALVDAQPAGLTTLYTREQRWGDRTIRAGYWSHLFVREQFRRLMVYPQLVLAMMRGIKALGIDCIFTGTRRPHVADGHVKLGFAKLGEYRVLYKPLRPFRLLARYKDWPRFVQALSAPGDAIYGATLPLFRRRPGPGVTFRSASASDATLAVLVPLLHESDPKSVRQVWTVESLRRRLSRAIDGYEYQILLAEQAGRIVGAAVYRLAIRERVCAGIIMELIGPADVALPLLGQAERRLRADGADTTLCLDSFDPALLARVRACGHGVSNETYQMLVWPKTLVAAGSPAADLANWRFSFLDHDAF